MAKAKLTPYEKRDRENMAKYAGSIFRRMKDKPIVPIETITTGSLVFDLLLEAGGFPLRYYSEVWGKPGVGKTTTMLSGAAQNSRTGKVHYIDVELKIPEDYFDSIILANGGNLGNITLVRPYDGNHVLGILQDYTGWDTAIYVDSVAAIFPPKMMNPDTPDKVFMGSQARFIGEGIGRIRFPLGRSGLGYDDVPTGTAIILVNQARMDFGATKGDRLKPFGGFSQGHGIGAQIKLGSGTVYEDRTGAKVTGWVTKNQVGRPKARGNTGILFDKGVNLGLDTLLAAAKMNMVKTKPGGRYYWDTGEEIGHGKDRAARALVDMGWDALYEFRDSVRAAIVASTKEEEPDVKTIEAPE